MPRTLHGDVTTSRLGEYGDASR